MRKWKNITVSIPADVYRHARIWAAERNTTISNLIRVLLTGLQTNPRAAHLFPAAGVHPDPTPVNTTSSANNLSDQILINPSGGTPHPPYKTGL